MINSAKDLLRPTRFLFIETVKLKGLSQSIWAILTTNNITFELKEPENSWFPLATELESES